MSSLINHTYENVAGEVTLTASSNDNLNVDVTIKNLTLADHTTGGMWKLEEAFNTKLVSPYDASVISTKSDSCTTVFNKFVTVNGYDLANIIRPGMNDATKTAYATLFGGTGAETVFNLWYNESCPIINIISFNPNAINENSVFDPADKTDCKQSLCIGLFGYPVAAFKNTQVGVASREFDTSNLTERSQQKLTALKTDSLEFTGTWIDDYFETVTASNWVKSVRDWVEVHNRGLISDERKNRPDFLANAVNKYDFGSLTYKLVEKQISDLDNLFFKVNIP